MASLLAHHQSISAQFNADGLFAFGRYFVPMTELPFQGKDYPSSFVILHQKIASSIHLNSRSDHMRATLFFPT